MNLSVSAWPCHAEHFGSANQSFFPGNSTSSLLVLQTCAQVQMAVRAVEEKHWRGEGATAMLCAGGAQAGRL